MFQNPINNEIKEIIDEKVTVSLIISIFILLVYIGIRFILYRNELK